MNFEGSCLKAEAILNGTMDTINMDPLTTLFIEVLQYTSEPGVVDAKLTAEEFEGKVKAWDERTSTSPASKYAPRACESLLRQTSFGPWVKGRRTAGQPKEEYPSRSSLIALIGHQVWAAL